MRPSAKAARPSSTARRRSRLRQARSWRWSGAPRFAEIVAHHDGWIVEDDAYGFLPPGGVRPLSAFLPERKCLYRQLRQVPVTEPSRGRHGGPRGHAGPDRQRHPVDRMDGEPDHGGGHHPDDRERPHGPPGAGQARRGRRAHGGRARTPRSGARPDVGCPGLPCLDAPAARPRARGPDGAGGAGPASPWPHPRRSSRSTRWATVFASASAARRTSPPSTGRWRRSGTFCRAPKRCLWSERVAAGLSFWRGVRFHTVIRRARLQTISPTPLRDHHARKVDRPEHVDPEQFHFDRTRGPCRTRTSGRPARNGSITVREALDARGAR